MRICFEQKTACYLRISDGSSDVCSSDLYFSSELARIPCDVAAVWPANSIALAAFLVWAPIYRTGFVLGVCMAVVAGSLLEAGSAVSGIGFAVANLAEVLVAAAILRRAGVASTLLGSVRNVLLFVPTRSEEHTSELQSLMRNSYAVFCLKKKN